MNALFALATAIIWRPPRMAPPPALEAALRHACAGAWRALEIMLAGDVLRSRLGRTSDRRIKASVEAVLALLGPSAPRRTEALTALRAARDAHRLDGDLDVTALVTRCAPAGTLLTIANHVEALQGALASDPALAAELGDPLLAALVLGIARELLHHAVRDDASLAPWAIPPAADLLHRRAGSELAALLAAPAAVDELDRLIAVPLALDDNVQFTVYRPRAIEPLRWHPLLVFAHLAERRPGDSSHADPVDEVRRQAEAVLGDHATAYQSLSQDSRVAIPADGELVLVPEIEGVEINPARRSFLWLEPVHREEFRIRAGPELVGKTVRGRLTVFLGHLAIAELALGVRIAAAGATPTPPQPTCARVPADLRVVLASRHRDREADRAVCARARRPLRA
jgi:hypothetical protein